MAKLSSTLIVAFIAGLFSSASVADHLSSDPSAQLVVDRNSGLAIFGYDPVAYHTDGRARPGHRDLAVNLGAHVWHFTSAANRAVFLADSVAYMPRFGGHDGVAVAEGVLTRGDPAIFVIAAGEVVFFRTTESRDRFAADPELRRKAVANWPTVVRQLAGH